MINKLVKKNIVSLRYASNQLQNDKELLLMLEKNKKKIKNYGSYDIQQWYIERMEVLEIYKNQEEIKEAMSQKNTVLKKVKVKKF
jgi:hypothetical protein